MMQLKVTNHWGSRKKISMWKIEIEAGGAIIVDWTFKSISLFILYVWFIDVRKKQLGDEESYLYIILRQLDIC